MTRDSLPAWPEGSADGLEKSLLETWKRERLFERTQEHTKDGASFVFYEGPPTANGRPGIHHVFARTIKDLICRFRALQGRQVTRIAGWDTHGLPVEIEVEKSLNLSGKKAIEEYGVEKFNALCRKSVFAYRDEWQALSDRIAYWLDYDNAYITCSSEYIESVWSLLKTLHGKNLLAKGHRVLPYCPRCGTVLSSHELSLGYETVRDKSVYVTFPLEDGSGRELVVWTTTPWTLPSNVAVAVSPDLEYGLWALGDGRRIILAVARAEAILGKDAGPPLERIRGSELVGLRYARPLSVVPLPADGRHSVVVAADFVTADDGSGIVHQAPAFGSDDYAVGQREGLAILNPVAPDGTFTGTTWPEIEGKLVTADETNELIIRRLKAEGRHLKTEQHEHSYPHCWRCQSKLIYYARASWFVRTSTIKDRLLTLNSQINWYPPETGSGRFGEWLQNNVDWALSRDRYWGTPLPVWVADDDPEYVEVIGSYAELGAKAGRPIPADFDPHKPFIDEWTWKSPGGGTMRRTSEVIDAWFDSGSMPYAQWHWPFEGEAEFRRHFPADYICEGIDQTRGWFYSLLAIAAGVMEQAPYRNVVVNELILDAEGQKMSKSRGNVVNPNEAIAEFGADTIRLYLLASSEVWRTRRFDKRSIPEVAGGFLNTLRNTYTFLSLYGGGMAGRREDGTNDARDPAVPSSRRSALDRWLLASLQRTVNEVVEAWENYQITTGVKATMRFVVDDLSNWYVRLSRDRFWAPGKDADPAAVAVLREALLTVCRLIAPAAPYASDWIHRAIDGTSVHLARFPVAREAGETGLTTAMDAVRTLASLARAARDEAGIRVRQPLARMRVAVPGVVLGPEFDALLGLLAQEVNVKAVDVVSSDTELVRLQAKPNFRTLGKRYGKQTPLAAAAASRLSPGDLRRLEAGEAVTLVDGADSWSYEPDDVNVERVVVSDWLVQSQGPFVAALDPHLDEGLRREGVARELVSRIQRLRKDAGYEYTTRIRLAVSGGDIVPAATESHREYIMRETLAIELTHGAPGFQPDRAEEFVIDEYAAVIAVAKTTGPAVHN
jgi:isoleucyl-tRNA synthetase